MAQIQVANLTFCYEGSFDNIFEDVSFSIDTNWKLGFIGRNGRGKTTFLQLLLGKHAYTGTISAPRGFDYFPYRISEEMEGRCVSDFAEELKPGCEEWRVICELSKLSAQADLLYRPFKTLSHGERTKALLAVLFSGDQDFLLIDEPTNHLDQDSRETVKQYLNSKKSFILVSHDRDLLDACIDHALVLNRRSIEVQSGNFSSWQENKNRRDHFARMENEKHAREIASLKKSADRSRQWAQKSEDRKIGYDPVKEPDRPFRPWFGAKAKKMQKRVKQYERRMEREIEAKEGLLEDIEEPVSLQLRPLAYHKERLIYARNMTIGYEGQAAGSAVLKDFSFELNQGERVFLHGKNGCGKSTWIRAILEAVHAPAENGTETSSGQSAAASGGLTAPSGGLVIAAGEIQAGSGLTVSYVSQDTGFLRGSVRQFSSERGLDESLFCALLRQLDMDRAQFSKPMENFSEGQKKKVLIAASLMTPAHLYIWDEPLNYIDVFSRMQIEELLLAYSPTMILVDHDIRFQERIATRVVEMPVFCDCADRSAHLQR